MRTKILCAAALAAGALTTMAQVYSANVVGYVNVPVTGSGAFTMICNPLNNTSVADGNNITNLFAAVAGDSDTIFRWDVNAFDFSPTTPTYSGFSHTWSSTFDLNVGEGVFYNNNNANFTVTFVGEVVQGAFTRTLVGSGAFNAIGSSAPIGGSFTNAIAGVVPADSDTIFTWNVAAFDFDPNTPTYSGFSHTWSSDTTVAPGIGFFYNNNNANNVWTRNFTVQ